MGIVFARDSELKDRVETVEAARRGGWLKGKEDRPPPSHILRKGARAEEELDRRQAEREE